MKKILFLLLVTIASYGQTYQNPTFGTITTKTAPTTTADPYVSSINTSGVIGKVAPENIPVNVIPPTTHYTPTTPTLKGHFQGIDNAIGNIPLTTAGNTTRVWFTGDATTITAGTFYLTNPSNKGTVANVSQSVINDDNQKKYFTQDLIGQPFATATLFPPGVYAGNLSASTTPNSAQQRFTVELYKCNNAGTPIASGVPGAPVGDLGVTVILILDSGLLTLADGSVTNVPVSASLASQFSIAVGERIRYHVSAEKVGTASSNITETVYYGNSYNSFLDVPTPITSSGVSNLSTVTGATVTNALDNLNIADQQIAGAGVTYGHINDGAQTIAGRKSFSDILYQSTTAVVTDANYDGFFSNYTSDFDGYNFHALRYGTGTGGAIGGANESTGDGSGIVGNRRQGGSGHGGDFGRYESGAGNGVRGRQLGSGTGSGGAFERAGTGNGHGVIGIISGSGSGYGGLFEKQGAGPGEALGVNGKAIFTTLNASVNTDMISLNSNSQLSGTEVGVFFSPTSATGNIRGARISAVNDGSNNISLKFYTGSGASITEKMRIFNTGGVSIGNTTDLGAGTLNVTSNVTTIAGTTANHAVIKSQLDLKSDLASPTFTGDPKAPTPIAGDNDTSIANTAFVTNAVSTAVPYKKYVALLSQTGTSAPTATVLNNTLGGTVVWTRTTTGVYVGTLSSAFPTNKTTYWYSKKEGTSPTAGNFSMTDATTSTIQIATRNTSNALADDMLVSTSVYIEVYP